MSDVTLENCPMYKRAYEVVQAIEDCEASPEATKAVSLASDLMEEIRAMFEPLYGNDPSEFVRTNQYYDIDGTRR